MDFESRFKLAEDLITGIRVPVPPPKGFNPLSANDQTLIRYGLPLPPNKATYPKHYINWENLMNQALTFVSPTFEIIERASVLEGSETTKAKDGKELTSPRWAGAVGINKDKEDPFQKVQGSWIVPRAYPLTVDWTDWGWKNRSWKSATWFGIDGYHTKDSHVLQGGTAEECVVSPR